MLLRNWVTTPIYLTASLVSRTPVSFAGDNSWNENVAHLTQQMIALGSTVPITTSTLSSTLCAIPRLFTLLVWMLVLAYKYGRLSDSHA